MDVKECTRCGQLKPLTEFYEQAGCAGGRRPECKACFQARLAKRYREEAGVADRARERTRVWVRANPERKRKLNADYKASGAYKQSARKSHLKRTFGLTPGDYDRMLAEQGGGCAICGRPPRDDISLHVDHDHATRVVRGLLCFPCNNSLGLMKEDPERLRRAAEYLERHGAQPS